MYTPKFSGTARDRASIPNLSSSPASPYKLTPAGAHLVRYPFGCWCDHLKCLTLCLWHTLLITKITVPKRVSEKRLATTTGRLILFQKIVSAVLEDLLCSTYQIIPSNSFLSNLKIEWVFYNLYLY